MNIKLLSLRPFLTPEETRILLMFSNEGVIPLKTKSDRAVFLLATSGFTALRGLLGILKFSDFKFGFLNGYLSGLEDSKNDSLNARRIALNHILSMEKKR